MHHRYSPTDSLTHLLTPSFTLWLRTRNTSTSLPQFFFVHFIPLASFRLISHTHHLHSLPQPQIRCIDPFSSPHSISLSLRVHFISFLHVISLSHRFPSLTSPSRGFWSYMSPQLSFLHPYILFSLSYICFSFFCFTHTPHHNTDSCYASSQVFFFPLLYLWSDS